MASICITFELQPYDYAKAPIARLWRSGGDWWLYRTDGYTGLVTGPMMVSRSADGIRKELRRLRAIRTEIRTYR